MCGLDTPRLAACPSRLSPVLTHGGQSGTSHPPGTGWSTSPFFLRSVIGRIPNVWPAD